MVKMAERFEGVVKWFNHDRGFGFIRQEEGPDVFVHHSALVDLRSLEVGDRVEFSVEQGEKGLRATQVVLLGATEA
jgi:CspA family cold shock protein